MSFLPEASEGPVSEDGGVSGVPVESSVGSRGGRWRVRYIGAC